ncbi:branched-chain amino acid ABC transporter permease [Nocardioides terrisoli]|uniref:branched-chain amino acid ABC transporter permease n=1 Tax=Nocardioides terrisoli TaxID=3388267 RepID=UPI00287B9985|nr:branched-chain amino acid ABC transporter permease [Nocardioides marmorisolisilvae]
MAVTAFILVLLGVSWNVMGGYAGIFSFGQAAFFGVGAYVAILLTQHGVHYLLGLAAAAGCASVCGFALVPCFRVRGIYFAIISLALASCLGVVANQKFPGGSGGVFADLPFGAYSAVPYYLAAGCAVLGVAVSLIVKVSPLGRDLSAIRADQAAAESVGVNAMRCKLVATLIGGGLAGLAGGVYATTQGFVDPGTVFNSNYSLLPILVCVLGGLGTVSGPALGGAAWSILNEVIRSHTTNGAYSQLLYGAALLALALFLPRGALGIRFRRQPRSDLDRKGEAPEPERIPTSSRKQSRQAGADHLTSECESVSGQAAVRKVLDV